MTGRLPAMVALAAVIGMSSGAADTVSPSAGGRTVLVAALDTAVTSDTASGSGAGRAAPTGSNGGSPNSPVTAPCPVVSTPGLSGVQSPADPRRSEENSPCGPAAAPPIALPRPSVSPARPAAPPGEQAQVVLKGLRLVDSAAKVQLNGVEASGIVIENLPILDTPSFREILQKISRPPGVAGDAADGRDGDQQLVSRSRLSVC